MPSTGCKNRYQRPSMTGAKGTFSSSVRKQRPTFELTTTPSKEHPGAAHRHPTPFEGRKPQRREGRPRANFTTRQLVWSLHQQGKHRRSRGASSGHLRNHGRIQRPSMGGATEQLACQVHKNQIASTHPSQLRHPVSHPPMI